jgi:signal transduction histidine kinase
MTRPKIKDRLLLWLAVPALAAVLAGLAVLQYRWSGQVSEAAGAQMQSNLHISLMGFRQDFARELGSAAMEIRSVVNGSSVIKPVELKEQFHHWQQTTAHPNLVSYIYLWQDPQHEQPLRFDPARDQFEKVEWPAEFDQMKARLLEISSIAHPPAMPQDRQNMRRGGRRHADRPSSPDAGADRRRNGFGRGPGGRGRNDALIPWAVDQEIPALSYPVRGLGSSAGQTSRPETAWLIIQLNRTVLAKEIFPELAQKYFRGASGMDYHVTVRGVGKDGAGVVLYSSDPGAGEDYSTAVDAALNLIGPPLVHSGPAEAGMDFFAAPVRPIPVDRGTAPDDRRGAGPERMPRFEPFRYADSHGSWFVTAKHKSGSVEAAVTALRHRNLMAGFGVLGVLAVTMGLILMASQRARRLARLQMDFVAGISHELRTPLAVISSAAENIAHGVVGDKEQLVRYGNTIARQSRQLSQLVEQVLLFAASQQRQRYGLSPVNISEVIDAALEGTNAIVAAGGFTIERKVDAALPPVKADFSALVQSLQNLITNAVKYGGESRWLCVSATAIKNNGRADQIDLSVEDRGIGIGKDEIKHIFEPFYRSPAVSEAGIHGTGLGLPLARTIVEAMGGRLTARSELGKGSAFTIHLPVAQERRLKETHGTADKPAGAEPDFSR